MTDLQNKKLQFSDVVWMNPVFSRLTNEITLTTTSRAIALDRVAPRPHNIKQPRKLNNVRIVVVFEERAFL